MFALPLLAIAGEFPVYFVLVYVVGFVAAVSLGLVAWYNSKRPVGWERSQRPGFIPKISTGAEEDAFPDSWTPPETAEPSTDPESPGEETSPS